MSAAIPSAGQSTAPTLGVSRPVRLVRVAVLLVTGFAIAFSATMHEQLGFDRSVTAVALAAIGGAHLVDWLSRDRAARTPVPLLLAISGVLAAAVLFVVPGVLGFALVVAAWALVSGLLEFVGSAVRPGSRQDATLLGAAGLLLALCVLLARNDQVAVLGFFGAYAVVAGVFLGISAFDTRSRGAQPTTPTPLDSPES